MLNKLSPIFTIIIIIIVYLIIFTSLRIMNKDIKSGSRVNKRRRKRLVGFEIVEPGKSVNLKRGGVIPIQGEITIGRKSNNTFVLEDAYVSGHHARIYIKNNEYILEDLGSTNGTLVNQVKINGKKHLKNGEIIKIGNTVLKFMD